MIQVVLKVTLDETWGTPEELRAMDDSQIIELCNEDITTLLNAAFWTVKRGAEDGQA